jgi:hypothetical protein
MVVGFRTAAKVHVQQLACMEASVAAGLHGWCLPTVLLLRSKQT